MNSPATSSPPQDHVLQGKRVLVTRAREQASDLEQQLLALGAVPLVFPTIRIAPPHRRLRCAGCRSAPVGNI
jgi:hypothetical protein